MRHSIEYRIGTGILTCYPSTTPFSLALGPTHPGMINMARETLGFRCGRLSLPLRLLIPAFSLPYAPRGVTPLASVHTERSPTMPHLFCVTTSKSYALQENLQNPQKLNISQVFFAPKAHTQNRCGIRSVGIMFEPRYIVGA